MFFHRLATTVVLTPVLIAVIYYSQGSLGVLIPLILSCFAVLGTLEFLKMAENKGIKVYPVFSALTGFLYLWGLYASLRLGGSVYHFESAAFFLVIFAAFLIFFADTRKLGGGSKVTESLSLIMMSFFYLPWCLGFFIKLMFLKGIDGRLLIVFLILTAKGTDIFSYVFGKSIGKHKMSPVISPNKTIEGAIGGLLCSLLIAGLCQKIFMKQAFPLSQTLLYGFMISGISILGDLTESLLKRDSCIKDSGGAIPGLGGILDMLDSILFAAPLLFLSISLG